MAKIDTVFDLSDKALGELKAWLEPWWQQSAATATSGGTGTGIQFDTSPQTGGYLDVGTTGLLGGTFGIRMIADDGKVQIASTVGHIEMLAGQDVVISTGDDLNISTDGDTQIDANGDFSVLAGGQAYIRGDDSTLAVELRSTTTGDVVLRLGGTAGNVLIDLGGVGKLIVQGLPTSDPGVTGAVWNSANTLKISP